MNNLEGSSQKKLKKRTASDLKSGIWGIFWTTLVCLVIAACQPQGTPTETHPTAPIAEINPSKSTHELPLATVSPAVTPALSPATKTTYPTLIPSPILIGPQIVLNSGFDDGLQGWELPYGVLNHTTADFHAGPGAARLITSSTTGFLEYRGSMGQCIDLARFLTEWPYYEGQLYITLEAYLRTDAEITSVTLNGIFLDDSQCGTGQVGYFVISSLSGDQPWTQITGTRSIPPEALSFHVFINANGSTDSATVGIDDLRAYPAETTD